MKGKIRWKWATATAAAKTTMVWARKSANKQQKWLKERDGGDDMARKSCNQARVEFTLRVCVWRLKNAKMDVGTQGGERRRRRRVNKMRCCFI